MTNHGHPAVALGTFGVVNPSTNEVFAHAPSCSPEQLDAAMESSAQAFRPWSVDEPARQSAMHEAADEVAADAEVLGPHGAKAVAGGHRIDTPGFFFEPTILAKLSDGVRIVDEEQLGPAMPAIAYRERDDAAARANVTHFGVGGSVRSPDEERAWNVATRLECGTSWVNTHAILPASTCSAESGGAGVCWLAGGEGSIWALSRSRWPLISGEDGDGDRVRGAGQVDQELDGVDALLGGGAGDGHHPALGFGSPVASVACADLAGHGGWSHCLLCFVRQLLASTVGSASKVNSQWRLL